MYYERRQSQRLKRFDLELDAILISVFINRAMWNLISHVHLYPQKMEAECLLHWNHKHSNKICEQIHIIMNINIKAIVNAYML